MTESVDAVPVNQADYMKVFMQELTYQDPLKPIDNREFMAQMAQFSTLQQATATNEALEKLIQLQYGNRAVSLLGKNIKIPDDGKYGTVMAVRFENELPELRVLMDNGGDSWVSINQINEIETGKTYD